ncbi:Phage capsid scaffolding protein (GPO) serine peptidase [Cedecea davisae]|uniref:Phage capsid scaffolding protein GpO n=1 Tax=Cedecea davisae DSM 4568 TaxID=566551 RepID=S3IQT2_9ENTR|nr:GPO family capsid scaffolding protein [Cedecea davisae]EPF14936.1 phage capsid scaffolding protein GpO [Cedecea davisae DSM 4568]SUX38064.1 Phage capsid scaffolding protein (GPO) serine peptidase [Cedecea davisae]
MPRLRTDWICVATAGNTADGREIKEEWLLEAAETYNPQTYTALIWPRHDTLEARAYSYNYGEVSALKTDRVDGVLKLFAQLMPNDWLIATNESGQKLFTSIEVAENFAGTGKFYLFALAVTDIPASLGTDRLMFSMGNHQSALSQGGAETFSLGKLKNANEEDRTREKTFIERFFSRFKETQTHNTEEDEMTKEQFDALMGRMEKQDTAIAGIQEQVKAFSAGDKPVTEPAKPEVKPEEKPVVTGITVEQFTQLEGKLDSITQKFDAMAGTSTTKQPDENPGEENKVWL